MMILTRISRVLLALVHCVVISESCVFCAHFFFFFKHKTAYEMRISDWSSDVCSSDLTYLREIASVIALAPSVPNELVASMITGASWRERLLGLCKIGRASCRERVCQYV